MAATPLGAGFSMGAPQSQAMIPATAVHTAAMTHTATAQSTTAIAQPIIIDTAIKAAVGKLGRENRVIDDQRPSFEILFQTKMNAIVDQFIAHIQEAYRVNSEPDFCQLHMWQCCIGTPTDIEAMQTNLAQRFHIFTSAYRKDFQPESGQSGYTSAATQIQRHTHSRDNEVNIREQMGWKTLDTEECWEVTFNWFCNEQGPVFIQENMRGWMPTVQIIDAVDAYVSKYASNNHFMKEYKAFWNPLVQAQTNKIAQVIQQTLMSQAEHKTERDGLVHFTQCLQGTSTEIDMICQFMIQFFQMQIYPVSAESHHHDPTRTIDCTRLLGQIHRGLGSSCYHITMHPSTPQPEPTTYATAAVAEATYPAQQQYIEYTDHPAPDTAASGAAHYHNDE